MSIAVYFLEILSNGKKPVQQIPCLLVEQKLTGVSAASVPYYL